MGKMKWLAVGVLLLFCPQVWAQSLSKSELEDISSKMIKSAVAVVEARHAQHVHIDLIGPAEDMALMMTFPAGIPSGFPNTYTSTPSAVYDPNTGTLGTLTWTETVTGSTNFNPGMPNTVYHTPWVAIGLGSIPMSGTSGPGYHPYDYMDWPRARAFDLENGCGQAALDAGNCTGESEEEVMCPLAGTFINIFHGMQAETAITSFRVRATGTGGTVDCTPDSSPPDFPGPFNSPDTSDVDREYRAQTVGFRFCLHPPCTGLLWTFAGPIKKSKQIPITPQLPCTNFDKGYITGQNVTY